MNMYHFFKKFTCGKKKGQISKNATAEIVADDEETAWSLFEEHPKKRGHMSYVVTCIGLAHAEELPKAGLQISSSWKVGDLCWTPLNLFDQEDVYREGQIREIREEGEQTIFAIWILDEYCSWRYRTSEQILIKPPRGRRARRQLTKHRAKLPKPVKSAGRRKSG